MRISLQPSFILHTRPFRDSSLLIDILTMHHGRVHAVARGARGGKSRYKALLQPFVPLLVSWSGKGELVNLSQTEPQGVPYLLSGAALVSGFYLNELLVRLLHRHDAHPELYNAYQDALNGLHSQHNPEPLLRRFELQLLSSLGYALPLAKDALSGDAILPERYYRYDTHLGFIACEKLADTNANFFTGKSLLALQQGKWQDANDLRAAKRLLRQALAPLLGEKPLKSRELFNY